MGKKSRGRRANESKVGFADNLLPNGEKVKKLYVDGVRDHFEQTIENHNIAPFAKSGPEAEGNRLRGNQLFARQLFLQSLQSYSQATIYAPHPISGAADKSKSEPSLALELSLAFANRSAALYQLKRYAEAIEDIGLALAYGYPKDKGDKLLKRKNHCVAALDKCPPEVVLSANEPSPVSTSKSTIYGFIDSIELFTDKTAKFRGLTGRDPIKANQLISTQKPFACILSPEAYQTHCYHCLMKLAFCRPFPCRRCVQVFFCDKICSDQAWEQYHRYECLYLDLLHICDNFQFPPKIALRSILSTGKEIVMDAALAGAPEDLSTLNYAGVFSLVDHHEVCTDYSLPAALMLAFVCRVWPQVKDDEIGVLGAALLKHIQQCQVNAVKIFSRELKAEEDANRCRLLEEVEIGCGLYQTFSLINHSCDPNAMISAFDGRVMSLRVTRDIEPGEELFISYGVHSKWQATDERKQYLANSYFFDCNCKACGQRLEPYSKALMCPNCEGPVICDSKCINCEKKDLVNYEQVVKETEKHLQVVKEWLVSDDGTQGDKWEQRLLESETILSTLLYPINRGMRQLYEALSMCYQRKNSRELAFKYARNAFALLPYECLEGSVGHINGLLTLIDRQAEYIRTLGDVHEKREIEHDMKGNVVEAISLLERITTKDDLSYFEQRFAALTQCP